MSALLAIFLLVTNGFLDYTESKTINKDITWENYQKNCGRQEVALNYKKANGIFMSKYYDQAISWDGEFKSLSVDVKSLNYLYRLFTKH